MTIRAVLISLVSLVMLQACGFHLRGKVELLPMFGSVYVQGNDKKLNTEVKNAFRLSDSSIVDSASAATVVVDIFQAESSREALTLDNRGKATSYSLIYTVRYRVKSVAGKVVLADTILSMNRDFNFDNTQVLQMEKQAEFLLESMRKDLALRMLNRLSRVTAQ